MLTSAKVFINTTPEMNMTVNPEVISHCAKEVRISNGYTYVSGVAKLD
jgi:hypothetical protein